MVNIFKTQTFNKLLRGLGYLFIIYVISSILLFIIIVKSCMNKNEEQEAKREEHLNIMKNLPVTLNYSIYTSHQVIKNGTSHVYTDYINKYLLDKNYTLTSETKRLFTVKIFDDKVLFNYNFNVPDGVNDNVFIGFLDLNTFEVREMEFKKTNYSYNIIKLGNFGGVVYNTKIDLYNIDTFEKHTIKLDNLAYQSQSDYGIILIDKETNKTVLIDTNLNQEEIAFPKDYRVVDINTKYVEVYDYNNDMYYIYDIELKQVIVVTDNSIYNNYKDDDLNNLPIYGKLENIYVHEDYLHIKDTEQYIEIDELDEMCDAYKTVSEMFDRDLAFEKVLEFGGEAFVIVSGSRDYGGRFDVYDMVYKLNDDYSLSYIGCIANDSNNYSEIIYYIKSN